MPRTYKRKSDRANYTAEDINKAVDEVVKNGKKIRQVSRETGIDKTTLSRYVKKTSSNANSVNSKSLAYQSCGHKVFNAATEEALCDYLKNSARMYFGLTPTEVKQLAFQLAIKNDVTIPITWCENSAAGDDWFYGFMKRHHTDISLRTPEATSIGRATSFNEENVKNFFANLSTVQERFQFEAKDIYNVDETGCTTVQKPSKVIAQTGVKQVGAITSAERGQLVTVCCAVNAIGQSIPPMFVFPRVYYKEHFVRDGPPGCIGTAHPSGWMTSESFLRFLQHFVKQVRCSSESPVLIILDNHDSHLSIDVLDFAKNHGLVMLTLPPHCSHKLQPLDCSIFGPFKRYYNTAAKSWMTNNPGKPMSIYDIPQLVSQAFTRAMTMENITSGFRSTGISPFDSAIFQSSEFAPSTVTDRSDPNALQQEPAALSSLAGASLGLSLNELGLDQTAALNGSVARILNEADTMLIVSSSSASAELNIQSSEVINHNLNQINGLPQSTAASGNHQGIVTPEMIRPFPKAPPRKTIVKHSRLGKSRILTDTPVKKELEEQQKLKKLRKQKIDQSVAVSKRLKFSMAASNIHMPNSSSQSADSVSKPSALERSSDTKRKAATIRPKKASRSHDSSNDAPCLYCGEMWSVSREKWVQCQGKCKKWSHVSCSGISTKQKTFMCELCI